MAWDKKKNQQQHKPASQEQVSKVLDQVVENLEKSPEQSVNSHNLSGDEQKPEPKKVEVKVKDVKQHPKFDKFKKGNK